MKTEHETKYEELAQAIGISALLPMVQKIVGNWDVQELLKTDPHLNTIRLPIWDSYHFEVKALVRKSIPGTSWSLANSVCVLKHVAKFHLPKAEAKA